MPDSPKDRALKLSQALRDFLFVACTNNEQETRYLEAAQDLAEDIACLVREARITKAIGGPVRQVCFVCSYAGPDVNHRCLEGA